MANAPDDRLPPSVLGEIVVGPCLNILGNVKLHFTVILKWRKKENWHPGGFIFEKLKISKTF